MVCQDRERKDGLQGIRFECASPIGRRIRMDEHVLQGAVVQALKAFEEMESAVYCYHQ